MTVRNSCHRICRCGLTRPILTLKTCHFQREIRTRRPRALRPSGTNLISKARGPRSRLAIGVALSSQALHSQVNHRSTSRQAWCAVQPAATYRIYKALLIARSKHPRTSMWTTCSSAGSQRRRSEACSGTWRTAHHSRDLLWRRASGIEGCILASSILKYALAALSQTTHKW